MSIKVIIAGFKGRMGQAAFKMVSEDPELELAGFDRSIYWWDRGCRGSLVLNRKEDVVGLEADVWVDFTMPKVAYMKILALQLRMALRLLQERLDSLPSRSKNWQTFHVKRIWWLDRRTPFLSEPFYDAILQRNRHKYFPKCGNHPNSTMIRKKMHRVEQQLKPLSWSLRSAKDPARCSRWRRVDAWSKRGRVWRDGVHSVRLPGLVAHQEVILVAKAKGVDSPSWFLWSCFLHDRR